MSQEALKKLEEQLNCSICLDTYTDPKQLQCHHVYCRKCLVKLVVRDQQGQLCLNCPSCRQVTPVPANGVAGLQPAFNIVPFLELRHSFKNPLVTVEKAPETPSRESPIECLEHAEEELKLYCETCSKPICFKCAIKGEKHHSHDYLDINDAYTRCKEEITSSLKPIEHQLTTISEALAALDAHCEDISAQRVTIENNLHSTFTRIRKVLDLRESELATRLEQITKKKLEVLAVQRDHIKSAHTQLSS